MLLITTALLSCKKEEEEIQQVPARSTASVSFNNGLLAFNKLDFYVNGTKKASLTDALHSGYNEVQPGKMEIKVVNPISGATIGTGSFEFLARDYSVFLCGSTAEPILLFSEDNLNSPATDNAKIRFVNLSPGLKNLSLNERGKPALFNNRPYKTSTSFENLLAVNEISFDLKETGSEATVATLEKVKIEKDKIYTIIATGERAENANIKLSLIVNK